MPVSYVQSLDQFQEIIQQDSYSVFMFSASWAGPSKHLSPVFQSFSNHEAWEHVQFFDIDMDEQPDVVQEAGVSNPPTFVVFNGGQKVAAWTGSAPAGLEQFLNRIPQ
ncbi:thioredoxin-like protein [Sistotremastrum suecicum HHB10207 ss-3]|uniref:Thioredoxin-like protein n=1 Tax=Sistotremastrum suecicum HHB10207 ss-3 TaxID=1314776 RepID=A0A166DFQ6_9AGAM|nr:thioredoxin-like protein [Sistotremastrum suecicum HHB10207 ss-3]